jgi:hypothetical protein
MLMQVRCDSLRAGRSRGLVSARREQQFAFRSHDERLFRNDEGIRETVPIGAEDDGCV